MFYCKITKNLKRTKMKTTTKDRVEELIENSKAFSCSGMQIHVGTMLDNSKEVIDTQKHQDSASPVLRTTINLILTTYTQQAVQQVLTTNPSSNLCTTVHIPHPDLPFTMKSLHSLHARQTLNPLHIFHHLCITAASPLIPCDRTVKVTINQTTYPLTPTRATTTSAPHHIHMFLTPHNRYPYVIHTHRITDQTTRRLELTTTLPSKTSVPGRTQ